MQHRALEIARGWADWRDRLELDAQCHRGSLRQHPRCRQMLEAAMEAATGEIIAALTQYHRWEAQLAWDAREQHDAAWWERLRRAARQAEEETKQNQRQ